ncbi:lipase family protein [Microbacterium sp. NPDC019599]|uniref:lipase family protein n=1 Tax=Microbacterium sp. NPDC019599 TaxID=3154690 RepID=UPI0033F11E13
MSQSGIVRRVWARVSVLSHLSQSASPQILLVIGVALFAFALLLVTRPLTSLLVLGIYVGASAITAGIIELRSASPEPAWWRRLLAVGWIVFGVVVIVWLRESLNLLPVVLSVLLVIGGLSSIGHSLFRGRISERVLAATWGVCQIVFGILALAWVDVTILVAAVVFGVWMLVFGVTLFIRGLRVLLSRTAPSAGIERRARTRRLAADAGRWMLAVVLVGVTIAGWWADDWLARGAPVVDAFYTPPEDIPTDHGRLLRVEPYGGRAPSGGEVQRILYTTGDAMGGRGVASALVITPSEVHPGPRPVIAWNHGTTGVARGCAPSLRTDAATKWAIPALEDALARGWVVVASDYAGQGAPGVFPYLIGPGEAKSTLDAVLAARELPRLWLSRDVVLWGHSQGGHAALWAAKIADDYARELSIKGTAALAPVTDPLDLARELRAGDANALLSVLISWVLVPYADTYPEVHLSDYIAPGTRAIVREMTQRCPSEPGAVISVVAAIGVAEDRPLYAADLTKGALGRRLEQNAVTGPFDQPVLLTWGTADEVIPPRLQEDFVTALCREGTPVRWVEMQGSDHLGVLLPPSRFLPVLVNWTQSRLSGAHTPVDDCTR